MMVTIRIFVDEVNVYICSEQLTQSDSLHMILKNELLCRLEAHLKFRRL